MNNERSGLSRTIWRAAETSLAWFNWKLQAVYSPTAEHHRKYSGVLDVWWIGPYGFVWKSDPKIALSFQVSSCCIIESSGNETAWLKGLAKIKDFVVLLIDYNHMFFIIIIIIFLHMCTAVAY